MLEATLEAPTLLVAMPQVQDPFFHEAVVLLVSHDQDGSVGFVINRSTDLKLAAVLRELDIAWSGSSAEATLLGGPVQPQLGTVLLPTPKLSVSTNGDLEEDEMLGEALTTEIAPGVSITQDLEMLSSLAQAPPKGLRLVLGYAGWSAGQLDQEVERHDWLVCPVESDVVFKQPVEAVWEAALLLLGINPSDLAVRTSESVH